MHGEHDALHPSYLLPVRAIWNGQVIAESDATRVVEGNHYFPADSVRREYLRPSDTHTTCSWKGVASYYHVEAGGREVCLDEIYLAPDVRNRGLGGRVLARVEAEARAFGGRRLFLEVERHNRAIGLYRRAGYLDHDRFLMSKPLDR